MNLMNIGYYFLFVVKVLLPTRSMCGTTTVGGVVSDCSGDMTPP